VSKKKDDKPYLPRVAPEHLLVFSVYVDAIRRKEPEITEDELIERWDKAIEQAIRNSRPA